MMRGVHAYITTAGDGSILADLEKQGVATHANPDVIVLTYTELSVDDARQISTYAYLKAVGDAKYFVISFDRANDAAQNALLKVVEEAPGSSHFFFSTPNPGAIIPTLRSRCIVQSSESRVESSETERAKEFLKSSYAERLSMVEKMITAAQRADDRTPLRVFARALVHARPCRETLDAARYLEQNGSSPKLVLSHLAVALPVL